MDGQWDKWFFNMIAHQHEIMNNTSETQAERVCNDNTYPMQLQQIGDFSTVVFKSGV